MSSITEEELKKLNEILAKKERMLVVIGDLEAQKHQNLHSLAEIETSFNAFTKELSDKYGQVNIDLKSGKIDPRDEEISET